MNTKGPTER